MYIAIDRNSPLSIKKQLYNGLTTLILEGTLSTGDKLPSTRALATQLNIARNSVIEIYEQLVAEGYAVSKTGQGTYIDDVIMMSKPFDTSEIQKGSSTPLVDENIISFIPGTPDLGHFPSKMWMSYQKDYFYHLDDNKVGYTEAKGDLLLREQLVHYLRRQKGISCTIDQVFITSGTSGALNTIAVTLKNDYLKLMTESPVMDFVPKIFNQYDYDIQPLTVDEQGLITEKLIKTKSLSLIYTAPSHQMPVGGVLPINRRKELLDYAIMGNHIIIEDDYDSEFRQFGASINALKQLDSNSVIYLGTFSKTLGPGLRIGYMVIPDVLVKKFDQSYELTYKHVQTIDQYCLYRMISDGRYEKHIYKMNQLYKRKREKLLKVVHQHIKGEFKVNGSHTGLHISLKFADYKFNRYDQDQLLKNNLEIELLTDYLVKDDQEDTDTLIIGFGHLSEQTIEDGVKILARYLSQK